MQMPVVPPAPVAPGVLNTLTQSQRAALHDPKGPGFIKTQDGTEIRFVRSENPDTHTKELQYQVKKGTTQYFVLMPDLPEPMMAPPDGFPNQPQEFEGLNVFRLGRKAGEPGAPLGWIHLESPLQEGPFAGTIDPSKFIKIADYLKDPEKPYEADKQNKTLLELEQRRQVRENEAHTAALKKLEEEKKKQQDAINELRANSGGAETDDVKAANAKLAEIQGRIDTYTVKLNAGQDKMKLLNTQGYRQENALEGALGGTVPLPVPAGVIP